MPKVLQLPIEDAFLLVYDRHADHRGYFTELYNELEFPAAVRGSIAGDWKQVSVSQSEHAKTIRGLHMSPYNKLCAILSGAIFDVIVDMRKDSPTYLRWCGTYLSEANRRQIHIPSHCLHGFITLEMGTRMLYLQGGTFSTRQESDCNAFDPLLDIRWPLLSAGAEDVAIIMSEKDRLAPFVCDASRRPELAGSAPRKRVLIIGASGQVGAALVEEYSHHGYLAYGTHNNYAVHHGLPTIPFDLEAAARDNEVARELLAMMSPCVVIISSALTHADEVEEVCPEHLRAVNVDGPRSVVMAAAEMGIKVVVYSSEYVWDGLAGPYSEEDPVNPLNKYGCSKVEMEAAVVAADPNALVLRTTVVYGPEKQGKNFVYQLHRELTKGDSMSVAMDQVSTPTYNRDLARVTRLLVDEGAVGIFNVVGIERIGRYTFASLAARAMNLDSTLLRPCLTKELRQRARRPLDAGMSMEKTLAFLGGKYRPRSIKECMSDWLAHPGAGSKPLGTHLDESRRVSIHHARL